MPFAKGHTWNKGKKLSEEHKQKIAEAHKVPHSFVICLICKKIIEVQPCHKDRKFCSKKCLGINNGNRTRGIKWGKNPPNCRDCQKELRNFNAIRCEECYHRFFQGSNHASWKGGITPLNHKIRSSTEIKQWRKQVFTRDDFRCLDCGERGGELQADHIFRFSLFPRLRLMTENGQTLCRKCHYKKTRFERIGIYSVAY